MIVLDTSHTLKIVLEGTATTQLHFYASYIDTANDEVGSTEGTTNDTTDVTLVNSPSSGKRLVRFVSIYNADDTSHNVVIKIDDGTSQKVLKRVSLSSKDSLFYTPQRGWFREVATAVAKFTDLEDTPNSYSGLAGKLFKVKSDETGLEVSTNTDTEVADAVSKAHTAGSESAGGDLSGTVGNATVETIGGKTKTDVADAVDKKHEQNKDQYLDYGGANQVSASQLKEVVNLAPNLMEKVSEVEVSSNCDSIDFDNLDGDSAWFYILFASVKNPTGSGENFYIYFNGDTTNTNYYNQYLQGNGSNANAGRSNDPSCLYAAAGETCEGEFTISLKPDNHIRCIFSMNYESPSSIKYIAKAIAKNTTDTNITSIRIQAQQTNGIGADSRFILFKARRG